jgi:hypothetical protein
MAPSGCAHMASSAPSFLDQLRKKHCPDGYLNYRTIQDRGIGIQRTFNDVQVTCTKFWNPTDYLPQKERILAKGPDNVARFLKGDGTGESNTDPEITNILSTLHP